MPMLDHSGTKTDGSRYLYKARERCRPLTSVVSLATDNLGHHGIAPVVFLFQNPVGHKKTGLGELMASWEAGNWPDSGSQLIGELRWLGMPWIKLLKRLLKCKYYGERIKQETIASDATLTYKAHGFFSTLFNRLPTMSLKTSESHTARLWCNSSQPYKDPGSYRFFFPSPFLSPCQAIQS